MSRTFSIKTLGCKLNQYETSQIAAQFLDNGWRALPFGSRVDLIIINTCTVTDRSDKKCRKYIRQGARLSKTGRVIVTGCLVDRDPIGLRNMPEVLNVFSNSEKESIYSRLDDLPEIESIVGNAVDPVPDHTIDYDSSGILKKGREEKQKESDTDKKNTEMPLPYFHTRGYIKIQDGCDGSCSYCIIPAVRGEPRSRPFQDILDHARRLVDNGCPELVLTGITIGKYNYNKKTLSELIEELIDIEGKFRIRITSIEPDHITDRLLSVFESEKICNHIHLPLQSGSDRVLLKMKRPYTAKEYLDIIDNIRKRIPDAAVGTDLIIGFPGEEDNDFRCTIDMVERAEFSYVHQFTFSPRSGTDAAYMKQDLSPDAVSDRYRRLKEISSSIGLEYRKRFKGSILQSVIEKNRFRDGYTAVTYNYIKVALESSSQNEEKRGELAKVRLKSVDFVRNYGIIAE